MNNPTGKLAHAYQAIADALSAENERLRAVNFDYYLGNQAMDEEISRLGAELAALRAELDAANIAYRIRGDAITEKNAELAALRQPVADEREASLADRMKAAGMMTIEEMMAGAPLDRFIRHAGVCDLATYGEWLDMNCREFLTMQASRELDKRADDDLYEWALAHAAVFQAARINFKAALSAPAAGQDVGALVERAEKFAVIEKVMGMLECDEREGGVWTACTLLLISSAHKMNSAESIVTQEGVTVGGENIGDWRVTVQRIDTALAAHKAGGGGHEP